MICVVTPDTIYTSSRTFPCSSENYFQLEPPLKGREVTSWPRGDCCTWPAHSVACKTVCMSAHVSDRAAHIFQCKFEYS